MLWLPRVWVELAKTLVYATTMKLMQQISHSLTAMMKWKDHLTFYVNTNCFYVMATLYLC